MSLRNLFISDKNANYIMTNSIKNIKNAGLVDFKNDQTFFNTFNQIASAVFKHEYKKLENMDINEAIHIINNIVINEITNYILSKKSLPKPPINHGLPDVVEVKVKEETFKIMVEDTKLELNNCINNINSIKVIELMMYNEDYIINETNNKLVFLQTVTHDGNEYNRECFIEIEPGNYEIKELFLELERLMLEKSSNEYDLYINTVSNKVFISSIKLGMCKTTPFHELISLFNNRHECNTSFTINKEKSTILKVLGFTDDQLLKNEKSYVSNNPIKLIKRDKLDLIVKFYDHDKEIFTLKEPIRLKDHKGEYDINHTKLFSDNNTVSLDKITIDFNGYNHRGYPYYLLLEITQKTV